MSEKAEQFLKQNSGQPASFVAECITVANAREYAKLYAAGEQKKFAVAMLKWMLEEQYKAFNPNNSGSWGWLAGGSSVTEWPERVYDNFATLRLSGMLSSIELGLDMSPRQINGKDEASPHENDVDDMLIEHMAAKTYQPAVEGGMAVMNKVMAGDWVQWDHYYGLVTAVKLMREQIKGYKTRLDLDKPNPFPDGYDAIDLLKDRMSIMSAEQAQLAKDFTDWTNDLANCDYYPIYDQTVSYGKCLGWQSRSDNDKCITTDELFTIFTEHKQREGK